MVVPTVLFCRMSAALSTVADIYFGQQYLTFSSFLQKFLSLLSNLEKSNEQKSKCDLTSNKAGKIAFEVGTLSDWEKSFGLRFPRYCRRVNTTDNLIFDYLVLSFQPIEEVLSQYVDLIQLNENEVYKLESKCEELVDFSKLEERCQRQQYPIFEFIKTEKKFIQKIHSICKVCQACLIIDIV